MKTDLVLTQKDHRGVYMLTLNTPENFNALSADMIAALQAALQPSLYRFDVSCILRPPAKFCALSLHFGSLWPEKTHLPALEDTQRENPESCVL